MASGGQPIVSTVPITALVDRCTAMTARHRRLFELLGAWAMDDPDAARQRWYATAAHRHAWHAELWDRRRPTIPVESSAGSEPAEATPPDDVDERRRWYTEVLAALIADTAALADGVDPELDPGTLRVTRLVAADLDELAATAPS